MSRREPTPPGPGQESVWAYPRPPRLERTVRRLRIEVDGACVADTTSAWRVLETSHPPVYYLPPSDIDTSRIVPVDGSSFCEFKGRARYFDYAFGTRRIERIAWAYPLPTKAFAEIANHLAFYASRVDACFVDDERVEAQDGDFYGGWITRDIVGPFKGAPGTWGW